MRVLATIGVTAFATSLFPAQREGLLLPVKASVRRAEALGEGDMVTVTRAV